MALKYLDRVRETTQVTGTSSAVLLGAVSGYRAFSATMANADTCYYSIVDPSSGAWENGLGTYITSNTLQRTQVTSSSNSGNLVNFGSGTKDVFITFPAAAIESLIAGEVRVANEAELIAANSSGSVAGILVTASFALTQTTAITKEFRVAPGCVLLGSGGLTGLKEARPEWFGVTGTNDHLPIQRAIDTGGDVILEPGKTYQIDGQIFIGAKPIYGNGAILQINAVTGFDSSRLNLASRISATGISLTAAIFTKSALGSPYYSDFNTQELYVYDLKVSMNRTDATITATPFLIENVTRGAIDRYTDTATAATAAANLPVNGLDLFANNKNIEISNSYFSYMSNPSGTMTSPQGGMWVRNHGLAANNGPTRGIVIRHCTFHSNQKDEPLAIFTYGPTSYTYGVDGVEVENSNFYIYDSFTSQVGYNISDAATYGRSRFVIATNLNSSTSPVQNVKFKNCYFETVGTGNSNIVLALQANKNNRVEFCDFSVNILATTGATGGVSVASVIQGASTVSGSKIDILTVAALSGATNVYKGLSNIIAANGNTIAFASAAFTTVSSDITYIRAIDTFTSASNNTVNGMLYAGRNVSNNNITGVIKTCTNVHDNLIRPATNNIPIASEVVGVPYTVYHWHDNYIEDTSGVTGAVLSMADTTATYFINNNYYTGLRTGWGTANAEGQVLSIENNVLNNTSGAPFVLNTSYVSSSGGNTPAASFSTGAKSMPIGHIVKNTNNATDTTIWGWMKHTTDGSNAAHWRVLAP